VSRERQSLALLFHTDSAIRPGSTPRAVVSRAEVGGVEGWARRELNSRKDEQELGHPGEAAARGGGSHCDCGAEKRGGLPRLSHRM
jgi:hypothetical protein